uniref:Msx2-interacting protein n=1 Tax=Nannospalax galili TaxID=1026970 RepID=A0A8C6QBN5_NANGA
MVRETRHLWVGNLPENVREEKIIEHFKRYGRVESVKILPKRGSEGGVAAFVDFVDIKSAQKAHNSVNKMGDRDLRTDYNEPGTIPSAARGLDDTVSIASRSREVSGFRGGGGGPAYGPPPSLHAREGRYERRLDGASDNRERAYEHSAYGHHERGTGAFDRTRHYDQDYYRDPRERTLQHGLYYTSRSRSPNRFDAHDPRYEPRAREQFTLPSVVHRDIYRDDITREVRGRRPERNYQHSRSRSPHSSQSRNQSPQRLASQASRPTRSPSGSGSRSRSSSSDSLSSSSSTSSDSSESSSSSSDDSPARSVQSAAVPAPTSQLLSSLEKDEPRKSFGIKVQNLPVRSTDTSLKDGLFHEFKKFGKVTSVQIHGTSEERYGLVFFRQQEDQEKALTASKGKLFFGMQIEVTAWIGPETESENEFRPLDERIDEFHPKATRTLFIGNLEKTTTYHDLRNIFQRFGEIVDIDIKKVNGVPQYAFLQYCDIASVCKAIKKMDGEYLGNNRLKLGFGKSMPTNCVWLDGLSSNVSDQYLTRHFCRYGPVLKVVFDRLKGMALVLYNEIEYAQAAVKETKGRKIGGNKIKVDFANRESQLAFYHCMEKSGQDIRDFYEMLTERRASSTCMSPHKYKYERRGSYDYNQDRAYYESVRTPGTYPEDSRRDYPVRGREFYSEWETYQGDYYESRYYDDPREYRDYRSDPYEQDIREYSYRQRERERERERFESERDRDHERRPIERSQSPVHLRRPQSPGASPSQSERLPSDPERRLYSRSSERSGSCSSLSPPRYDKLDKVRLERYTKNEKTDKERTFDPERVEKERRLVRKEKVEKEKSDKQKRKGKVLSPSSQSSETEQENEREQSPEKCRSSNKPSREKADKEGIARNRLELMPCVVLTRVKEKEGKVIDHPPLEKLKARLDNDTGKCSVLEHKFQASQPEPAKSDSSKVDSTRGKVPRDKALSSHTEVSDKEGRPKLRKHLKPEQTAEGLSALDLEKLEARKRRFADSSLKAEKQKPEVKKSSSETEDARVLLKKQPDPSSRDVTLLREGESERKPVRKEILKRESKKIKLDRLNTVPSPKDCQELVSISPGSGLRPSSELQARLGEPVGESVENQDTQSKKAIPLKPQLKQLQLLDDQGSEKEDVRKNYCSLRDETPDRKSGQEKPHIVNAEEKLGIDIDHTQSYRKQMEQSRRKQQMEMEIAKSEKFGSPKKDVDEYERRSLVHEVGKPPQDVTDDSPPSKKKRMDHVDFDICTKRERNYRSSRQVSEESERTGCSPSARHGSLHEDDDPLGSPRLLSVKGSPKVDEKGLPYSNVTVREESLKFNPYDSSRREQMADMAKIKLSVLSSEEELNRWDSQMKQDSSRFDVSFPNSIIKRDSLRKRSVRDLEPGEVPSDSDEDGEHRSHSPRASTLFESPRLSFLLRDREDKLRERDERLSSSLERNKFYSFALDKTITPDTKALLERAKSLSSSREENWSFLDWDSRFANFRNNKDKEKVDSTPRPIPSWYMKKKKIRTDSEGKLDDKKEDHKEEEQERQELFASRFLHSSIFEQDSKRLQHLERKDEDPDFPSGRLYGRQASDGANSTSDPVQEPVVLFHSRFMELTRMQQKEKEKDQKSKETEKQEDIETHPKAPEPVTETKELDPKPPVSVGPPVTTAVTLESEPAAPEKTSEKTGEVLSLTEEKTVELATVLEEAKPVCEPAPVAVEHSEQVDMPPGVDTKKDAAVVPSAEESSTSVPPPCLDVKPPTPGASFSQVESNIDAKPSSPQPLSKAIQKSEEAEEQKVEKPDPAANVEPSANQKAEVTPEIQPPASEDVEADPPVTTKDKKTNKSKRSRTPVQAAVAGVVEKPVTRKSERIDREKLKRSSSPRGEAQKLLELKMEAEKITRTASANSLGGPEHPEHPEPSLPLSRTRRRNVRSVYATMGDHGNRSPAKEPAEQPRVTRKRLEREQQETVAVPTTPRRGRPPKTRRRADEDDENESKEPVETVRPAEGWRSPRSQKSAATGGSQGKRGRNEPKVDVEPAAAKRDRKETSTDKSALETPPAEVEKKTVPEKTSKSKRGRSRNTRSAMDRSAHLKSLDTASSTVTTGAAGQVVDSEAGVVAISPEKSESPPKEGSSSSQPKNDPVGPDKEPEKEDVSASKLTPEATQLAKQMELEQAVENIAKFTEPSSNAAYKGAGSGTAEGLAAAEKDKPAHQASETELAAAIGSIINDISGESENFSAPSSFPPGSQTDLQPPEEGLEPETNEAVNTNKKMQAQSQSPAANEETMAVPQEPPQEEKQSEEPPPTPPRVLDDEPQARFKVHSIIESDPVTPPSDSSIPPPTIPLVTIAKLPPPATSGGVPHQSSPTKVTEWITRQEEPRAQSTPSPALPPDTKASDVDTSSSTLRKILMDPKYVSATGITSTSVTTAIADRMPTLTGLVSALTGLVNVSLVPVNALKGPVKGLVSTPAGPVNVLKGPVNVLTGPVNVLTTPVNATVSAITAASGGMTATTGTATMTGTVIAPSAKCKQRSSSNENSRFHPGSMSVIDDRPADTGSGAGLRVNTSEGVVLLSYSGQKTEGPQRISAKISQIPPASAMDIEFQQSVSKSQVKPDSIIPSQSAPKGPQTPSAFANVATHSTLVLTAQTYNASPVISSVKADRPSLEKPEPIHLSVSTPVTQGGTVKVLTQGINTPPVLVHNQLVLTPSIVTTNKKLADPVTLKIETKVLQPANLGSTLTPHHPPALPSKLPTEVNHVPSVPSSPADRTISHLAATKPDTHSPRPSGPTASPFPRACHPSSTTSTALSTNATVMLAAGIPVPQFISSIHPEQSVIMPPHSITQTVSLGHLSQGEVRMNTPTLPSITYSIRPETLHSPRAPLQPQQIEARAPQRVGTPQPVTASVPALASQHPSEEEVHYHLPVARAAAPVQSEVLVMQSEYRLHPYTVPRDVRIMVHPHVTAVSEQPRATEGVVKVPPASKAPQQLVKEAVKTSDAKVVPAAAPAAPAAAPAPAPAPPPPPHGEARILTVTPSNQLQGLPLTPPVVVTHGVQIVHSSGELFQEYRYGDIRTYHAPAQLTHTQFPITSSIGLPSRTKTSAQGPPEGEPLQSTQPAQSAPPAQPVQSTQPAPATPSCQPSQLSQPAQPPTSKMPQVSQEAKGTQTGVEQPRLPAVPANRPPEPHAQVQRAQVETGQPAHPSPVSVSVKPDLPAPLPSQAAPKQPLFVPATSGPSTPPVLALPHADAQPAPKQDASPHLTCQRPVDMVQLLKKYPIVWQGLLALKNDTAAVQLHFVSGNNVLAHRSLPLSEGGPPLRIAQRMRLEASQLEGVARRMTVETDYCLLLALPCGRDQEDVVSQTESLKAAFITYLQAKQAAGIINVPNPGSNQPAYVLQIFPPCEFSESHLSRLAPDLLASVSNISPHLMIVIASV